MPYDPVLSINSSVAVTFLALGNGAPDISSSIAAISSGSYELALGALMGEHPLARACSTSLCSHLHLPSANSQPSWVIILLNGGVNARNPIYTTVGFWRLRHKGLRERSGRGLDLH